jgi:hypothetical protein
MRRRVALALFTALAVLAVPATATATTLSQPDATDGHVAAAAGITLANRHATVVHLGVSTRRGHDRRAPQRFGSFLALSSQPVGAPAASAWAHLATTSSSLTGELPSASRPRAPPAVV